MKVQWNLDQIMLERGIDNPTLGAAVGRHRNQVSRVRNASKMPTIDSDQACRYAEAINRLCPDKPIRLSDLVQIID